MGRINSVPLSIACTAQSLPHADYPHAPDHRNILSATHTADPGIPRNAQNLYFGSKPQPGIPHGKGAPLSQYSLRSRKYLYTRSPYNEVRNVNQP